MNYALLKKIANRALSLRGLRLAPSLCYGLSQATDFKKLWQDLHLPTPLVIVDIGANHGEFSLEIHGYFPDARVIAVEPNPDLAQNMLTSKQFKSIEVVQAALGDTCRSMKLNMYTIDGIEDSPISSLRHSGSFADVHGIKPSKCIDVTVTTLDNLCLLKNINTIDICKIDVEGFELEVLSGAAALLGSQRVKVLSAEWSTRGGQERGKETTLNSLVMELSRRNYFPVGSTIDWCKTGLKYFNNNMLFMGSDSLNSSC
jgi:FkbM family methyltransferase